MIRGCCTWHGLARRFIVVFYNKFILNRTIPITRLKCSTEKALLAGTLANKEIRVGR